jgi:hypothetical protein
VTGWDRGTLDEVAAPLLELRGLFPGTPVLDAAVAHVWCATGRHDKARAVVDPWFADPGRVPEDSMWLFTLALLAETCWCLQDAASAGALNDLLEPTSGRLVVVGSGVACFGAVDRSRGLLALTTGRSDEAVQHFQRAVALHEKLDARPWLARTQGALALALLQRDRSGDDAMARHLLQTARRAAHQLGAPGLVAWLRSIGGSMKARVPREDSSTEETPVRQYAPH